MDVKALQGQYATLIGDAKKLAEPYKTKEADMPEPVQTQIAALLGKSDEVKVKLDLARKMELAEASLGEANPQAAWAGWRNAAPGEGEAEVDGKSWRELEIKNGLFNRIVRYSVPIATEKKEYAPAFEAYLRKGVENMRMYYPNDFKTLTVGGEAAGGYLVPPEFYTTILKRIMTTAVVRQYARVIQTSRDVVQWPRIKYTDATDGNRYTSGVRLTWTGESPVSASAHRVTEPVFGLMNIPVNTAMASLPLSNNLIEDAAYDINGDASGLIGEAFALGEEDAFINGTGVAQPRGMLFGASGTDNDLGPVQVSSGSTSTPYFTYAGLLNIEGALPSQYETNAIWLMRKGTVNFIRQVQVATNSEQLFWTYNVADANTMRAPQSLLGYPVYKSEFVPVATGAGNNAAIFGDLQGYLVLDRVGFSIQRLSELYAETNITVLLARHRVGGQLVEPYRIKVGTIAS